SALQRGAEVRLAEQTPAAGRAERVARSQAGLRRRAAVDDALHEQAVVAIEREPDVLRQRPRVEILALVEALRVDRFLTQHLRDLMAMQALRLAPVAVRGARPRRVARQIAGRSGAAGEIRGRAVDVPRGAARIV